MKRFNVNSNHDMVLNNFKVPYHAIYGKDNKGLFVCTCFIAANEPYLYRYDADKDDWEKCIEYSDTLRMAYSIADKSGLKVSYWGNHEKGLKSVLPYAKKAQTTTGYMFKVRNQFSIDKLGRAY